MRIAIALGGTDRGVSGIGVYVRSVLPHLLGRARSDGGSFVALGTRSDLEAYALDGFSKVALPSGFDPPAASALFHLTRVGAEARRAGADVLLLPAANRRMAWSSPVPTVAVVHDLAQLRVRGKYDAMRMVYVNHVLTRALSGAEELVAVSGATRDDMAGVLGISRDRIRVVLNGVDVSRFTPPEEGDQRVARAREEMGLSGPYVLYASRLEHPGKNHVRLVRAFAASRARSSHTLVFAGKEWGGERLIRAEVAALGLSDRVRLLGFVPDDLLPGLVAGADAVAMVGLHEGFGLPALEALAAGRSVVASSSGALPEVVGPLAALCDPLDERSMREALDRALFDVDLRARAALEGPAWAARFSWSSTADGLYESCRRAASAGRDRAELRSHGVVGRYLRGRSFDLQERSQGFTERSHDLREGSQGIRESSQGFKERSQDLKGGSQDPKNTSQGSRDGHQEKRSERSGEDHRSGAGDGPSIALLPRARLLDVLRGKAPLIGSRLDKEAPRGLISPVESRIHLGIPYGDMAAEEARLLRERSVKRDAGVIARALFTAALAPKGAGTAVKRPLIVSARVDNVTIDQALDAIFAKPGARSPVTTGGRREGAGARMVHFVHPHALNLAAFNPDLARAFAAADLVLPDGVGIRVAASILGVSMRHNLNGTDLLPLLCRRAAAEGAQLALIGAAKGVADACADKLRQATPGLSIALVSHGFLSDQESRSIADRLRALGPAIVLIGMGSPIQERWAWRYLRDAPNVTALTVGGLFDFFSGRIPRAPIALRELGLEWVFRLAQEPRRLMRRYLVGNPLFVLLALWQRLFGAPAAEPVDLPPAEEASRDSKREGPSTSAPAASSMGGEGALSPA